MSNKVFTEEKTITEKEAEHCKNDPVLLSLMLLERYSGFIRCDDNMYEYNGKCYDMVSPIRIETIFHRFIRDNKVTSSWKHVASVVRSVLAYDDITTYKHINDEEYKDLICLNNGVLNIYTKELLSHSPSYIIDSCIGVDYDPNNNECPTFTSYLADVFNNDEEIIENIIRLGGYLLDTSTKAQKIFFFDGNGGSGKSTLIDTFSLFFDNKQISGLSLDDIAGKDFDRELLIPARANFTAEASKGYLEAEEVKKVATSDLITVKRKYKISVTFRPKVKIIAACNGMPKIKDTSGGIERRLMVFPFPNVYKTENELKKIKFYEARGFKLKDPDLLDKIKKELPAILNLFLDGLVRLRKDRYEFVPSKTLEDKLQEYRQESDSLRGFFNDWYEIDFENEISAQDIYFHYRSWYRENVQDSGTMRIRITEMGKRIKETYGLNVSSRKRVFNSATQQYEKMSFYNLRRINYAPTDPLEQSVDINFNI